MKISEIREPIRKYEKTWYRKLLYGNDEKIIKLKQYLKALEGKPGSHELVPLELFDLVKIISFSDKRPLMESIRNNLRSDSHSFFKIITLLDKSNLLVIDNFIRVYNLSAEGCNFLHALLCDPSIPKPLTQKVFEATLILSSRLHYSNSETRQCFTLLRKAGLLNRITLNQFSENIDNFSLISQVILRLNNINQLNDANLNLIFKNKNFTHLLHFFQMNVNENCFESLMSLSKHNSQRLDELVSRLAINKALNSLSFEKALQKVTLKLPEVEKSIAIKKRRKETGAIMSEFSVGSKMHFFLEHSNPLKYDRGGFGAIKKGYDKLDAVVPSYSIKKLLEPDMLKSQKQAIREVKYHRLLGREAFYYISDKGKANIVAEWQHEKGLHLFTAEEMKQAPVEKRLQCVKSGLVDMNKLHLKYRVHGDIKCQNFILDLKNGSMELIDFGASRKKGSNKHFAGTLAYRDHTSARNFFYDSWDDMYAMGIVTAYLFPELYAVTFDFSNDKSNVEIIKNENLTNIEQAILIFVNKMMNADRRLRCTSESALDLCEELIRTEGRLDEQELQKIMGSTINRFSMTIEDAMRGARPSIVSRF